jgi:hypothetical protein
MEKLVILTMVVALFIGIPFCVFAQEQSPDASKMCKYIEDTLPHMFAFLFKNLGHCLSSVQACGEYGNSPESCICRQLRWTDPEYETRYGQGLGPCIIDLRTQASLPQ